MNKKAFLCFVPFFFCIFLSACKEITTTINNNHLLNNIKNEIPTLTPSPILTLTPTPISTREVEGIEYVNFDMGTDTKKSVEFTGNGILIDLNGDQIKEKLYADNRGLNINGIWYYKEFYWDTSSKATPWNKYYILDIDSTDSYKEILLDHKSDWSEFLCIFTDRLEIENIGGFPYTGVKNASILGDKTVTIPDARINCLVSYQSDVKLELNEEHGLSIMPGSYKIPDASYPLELLDNLSLYKEKDKISPQFNISPQSIEVVETDGIHWVKIRTEDQEEGWLYYEYNQETNEERINDIFNAYKIFTGFSTAG